MDEKKRPGRPPRALRPEETTGEAPKPVVKQESTLNVISTEKAVKNSSGKEQIEPVEGFDFKSLHSLKPWKPDEPLPPPETRTDRKGRLLLLKKGEPRFFFRGNHLIKIYRGFGKKTELYKRFVPQKKKLHIQIMQYLKSKVGIQEKFD